MDFTKRIRGHYNDMQRRHKPFYTDALTLSGGFKGYIWTAVYTINNYADLYINTVTLLTPAEKFILDSFTKQEIRSVEQSLSTYCSPEYYKGGSISMNHINWTAGYVPVNSAFSIATLWVTKAGEVFSEESISKASKALGLYVARIKQVANCTEPYFIETEKYGAVQIFLQGLPTTFFFWRKKKTHNLFLGMQGLNQT